MTVAQVIAEYIEKFTPLANEPTSENLLAASKLRTKYLQKVSKLENVEDEILAQLESMTADPCVGRPDLWLLAAQLHPSERYRQPLCDILVMPDECIWHEGIIEVFVLTKDANAVPCLEQAIGHNVNGIAVQAITALAEIGTREAIQVIKNCLESPHERIREQAHLMLEQ